MNHDTTGQLIKCAPEEPGKWMCDSPVANPLGPAFLSRGSEQVDRVVAFSLESCEEPLCKEACPAGAALPLHATCHILTGSNKSAEGWSLQAHIDTLLDEQAVLEASLKAPYNSSLLLPDSLDLRFKQVVEPLFTHLR